MSKCERLQILRHSSVCPFIFTEQGEAMLSSVRRSEKEIRVNIEVMRAFSHYRALLHESNTKGQPGHHAVLYSSPFQYESADIAIHKLESKDLPMN